jgi:oligopeptide transport system substrate-binding protein
MVSARPLACLLLFGGLASACSRGEDDTPYFGTTARLGKDPHTLYMNNGSEPEYLDPSMVHDTASSTLAEHLFEGLATYGPDAEPSPGVALRWDQTNDNRFFRFHLDPAAKWSDGKPVTAHDFEYAWKRVLTPKTAAQSAANLYSLKNGELFNTNRLKRAKGELVVRADPGQGGKEVARVEAGTPVVILARSPMKVDTVIEPLAEAPKDATALMFDKSDPKAGMPEKLRIVSPSGEREIGPGANAGGWNGQDVAVIARLGPVTCNDGADFFYEVSKPGGRGVLPGCMLARTKSDDTQALIARHDDLPTFDPTKAPALDANEKKSPDALGFVPEKDLESDASVVGVRSVDDRTLEVELAYPVPYFLDLSCNATLAPVRKDVIEKFEAAGTPELWTRPENIVSNGPYMLDTWKFRYAITMKRNPHHPKHDLLKIHKIVFTTVESYASTMNLYKSGELDYMGDNASLVPDYIPTLKKYKKDYEVTNYVGTYWYEFNTKTPPLDQPLVRRALNLAVDKQEIVDRVTLGGQLPATHAVPDFTGSGYAEQAIADKKAGRDPFSSSEAVFNPERARELLTQAGYKVVKDGDAYRAEGMPAVEILYNTSEGHKKIAVTIQDMWKKNLGVSVTLRNEEWKVMLKNVRDRNFQVARFGWIADYNHPQTFLDTFLSYSPNNRTGWSSASFDAMVKRAAATADPVDSIRIFREAEKILIDESPKMPIYFYTKNTLIKPYVKGFHFNIRNQHRARWLWIDPDWQNNPSDDPAYAVPQWPKPGEWSAAAAPVPTPP